MARRGPKRTLELERSTGSYRPPQLRGRSGYRCRSDPMRVVEPSASQGQRSSRLAFRTFPARAQLPAARGSFEFGAPPTSTGIHAESTRNPHRPLGFHADHKTLE